VKEDLIRLFPTKRVSPFDGMAVTADVWAQAHEYHRQRQQLHALFNNGAGIVTGLQVIASDPPDSAVYILPGVAVDDEGQVIVLPKPRAYNMGTAQGYLYLLLTYGQSGPRADEDEPEGMRFLFDEFGIQATPILPSPPYVELARIWREGRETTIADAQDPSHPELNEIDLRFRQEIGRTLPKVARIAAKTLGDTPCPEHEQGISYLARACRRAGLYQAWVDKNVALDDRLSTYALVYLSARSTFQLERDEMNALYAYLQEGGTVLCEGCRQELTDKGSPADTSFADLLGSFGIELEALPANHDIVSKPNLFRVAPPGFETEGEPGIQIGRGVILSTYDYGCLWQGERRSGPASREEIRTALEWGGNILSWAAERRRGPRQEPET
jgi:hypothetical protein